MNYTYIGKVAELPTENNKKRNVVLKDNKVYLYLDGWHELLIYQTDIEAEIREIVKKAEDSQLKTELLQLFEKVDKDRIVASNI